MEEKIEVLLAYLEDKKAKDIAVFDVHSEKIDENTVILANFSTLAENKAFAEELVNKLGLCEFPEGYNKGEWIIFTLDDIILHTFIPAKREKYNLDKLYQSYKINLKGNKRQKTK